MAFIFGPVPSRRLGLSLGVDLIPPKTCTFDCLYCQVGKTTSRTLETGPYVSVNEVVKEIENKLQTCTPDAITLAGSGEPTLNSEIGRVITAIKVLTQTKMVLLTNGSLFSQSEIRRRVLKADIIMPTLNTAFDHTFRMIHQPHPGLDLSTIIDGLKKLRQDYQGHLYLEVVFLAGINDTERELERLKTEIDLISPDKIHINTVVRPPADPRARSLDRKRMEDIRIFFGNKAEIVAEIPVRKEKGHEDTRFDDLLGMVRRRPLKPDDIASALGISMDEVNNLVKSLMIKGYILKQEHSGDIYYISNEKNTD